MTPGEVIDFANEQNVQFVNLRFSTGLRRWRHTTIPIERLEPSAFDVGHLHHDYADCDHSGPLTLLPDPETVHLDPFCQHPTLALICDVRTPGTNQPHPNDLRAIAHRAAQALTASDAADTAEFALTLQFNVLDRVVYDERRFEVDAREAHWRSGRDDVDNLGLQLASGEGHGALPPSDTLHNLRGEIVAAMSAVGIAARNHDHGPDSFGHTRIQLAPAPLLRTADNFLTAKYVIRNVADRYGKTVTFLPQPLAGACGNGMSVEIGLRQGGQLAAKDVRDGLARHTESLAALCLTTSNSYRRQIVSTGAELTGPPQPVVWPYADALCDPYVALSGLLLASLDDSEASSGRVPRSLEDALMALEADHAYLRTADVFPADFVERWTAQLRAAEIEPQRYLPTPFDYQRHFNS